MCFSIDIWNWVNRKNKNKNKKQPRITIGKFKKKEICASLKFSHCLYFPNNQLTILLTRMCTKSKTGLYVRCWSLSTREALTGNTCDCCSIIFVTIEYLRNLINLRKHVSASFHAHTQVHKCAN